METQTGLEAAAQSLPLAVDTSPLTNNDSDKSADDAASTAATIGEAADQDAADSDNQTIDSSSGVDESADTGSALSVTSLPQRAQRPQVSNKVRARAAHHSVNYVKSTTLFKAEHCVVLHSFPFGGGRRVSGEMFNRVLRFT